MFRVARCALLVLGIGIAACSGNRAAPVADRTLPTQPNRDERVVVAGDTLYSIAWEAGHDYKEVARWNRIGPPYRLQPGQTLKLSAPSAGETRAPDVVRAAPPAEKSAPKKSAVKAPAKPTVKPVAKTRATKPTTAAATPRPPLAPTKPAANIRATASDIGPWTWPSEGKIISASSKGIDIAGNRAQSVRAAAPGKVVYAGSGLRGYGQLIILKHSEDFLSAYAHNDKIHVKEGDVIKRGQQIAEMGSSGADRVKLHFEIRRGGVPVDPLQFLPKH